jgi:hypothetical protein
MTDKLRLFEKIRINEELRMTTKYNEQDTLNLVKFRGMNASDNYVITQIKKVTEMISTRTEKLNELNTRLEKLENGELDEEMIATMKQNTVEMKEKGAATIVRKKEAKAVDAEDSKKSKEFYQQERKSDKQDKSWYYKSAERHFNKSCDSIPEYMIRELKKMPSNNGYVWRGVYCFGSRNPTSATEFKVTENQKGKKIITHWNKTHISVYEKVGAKGREILLSRTVRKNKG